MAAQVVAVPQPWSPQGIFTGPLDVLHAQRPQHDTAGHFCNDSSADLSFDSKQDTDLFYPIGNLHMTTGTLDLEHVMQHQPNPQKRLQPDLS